MVRNASILALVACILPGSAALAGNPQPPSSPADEYVVWTTPKPVQDVAYISGAFGDGSDAQVLVPNLNGPWDIDANVNTNTIFWGDINRRQINQASLDGTISSNVFSGTFGEIDDPGGIAVHPDGSTVFWSDFENSTINTTDLLGGTTTTIFNVAGTAPIGLDVVAETDSLYWADFELGVIRRAATDGTGITDIITSLGNPRDVEAHFATSSLYWVDLDSGIFRSDLDGNQVELLSSDRPNYLALTPDGNALYWVEQLEIFRLDLLTGATTSFGIDQPGLGIAVVPEPATLALLLTGGISLLTCRRRRR